MSEALETEPALEDVINSAYDEQNEPVEAESIDDVEQSLDEPQTVEEAIEALEAPEHWAADIRDQFGQLSSVDGGRTWQEFLLNRHKEMEGDYTKKTQSLADERKQFEQAQQQYQQFEQLVQPYSQQWAMQGINPMQGIQSVLATAQALQQNPQDVLLQLAKQYNVDLESAIGEQPYVDPRTHQLEQQIAQQEQRWNQFQNSQVQAQQQAAVQQITSFKDATDATGNLAHPYFDEVYPGMTRLMELGHAKNLDEAYQMACQYSPEIQQKTNEEAKKAESAQRAKAAKKASEAATVVESKTTDGKATSLSLDDDIAAAYEAQIS